MKLNDLDDRLVPRIAARLRGLLDGTSERRRTAGDALSNVGASGPLRRLDERFASSGPLALLRDVPQIGLLLIAAIFLSGASFVLVQSGGEQRTEQVRQRLDSVNPTSLGPPVGTKIDAYLAATRKRAMLVSQAAPDAEYVALVSFRAYLTPEQARLTLGDLDVDKVVLHAKLPASEVLPVAVQNLVPEVRAFYRELSRRKTAEANEFANLAASITGQSKEEQQFKVFYVAAAKAARQEAKAYGVSCPCVIGALVRGTARDLAALPAVKNVRAVEVGGRTADDGLQIEALLPEQKGVVTKLVMPTANG